MRPTPPDSETNADPSQPTVQAIVREQAGVSWSRAKRLCTEGRVTVNGERCLDPAARVAPGMAVIVDPHAPKVRALPLAPSAILYDDRDVVVVDKPAGMLSVADEEGNRDTLVDHLRTLLRQTGAREFSSPRKPENSSSPRSRAQQLERKDSVSRGRGPRVVEPSYRDDTALGVVQRLDRDTSGLMLFTRSATAKRVLATQFREHTIERVYHAIVHGDVAATRADTWLLLDRGDGLRGSHGHFRRTAGEPPADAKRAVTHIRPIAALNGATLVECRLETGRQHQIRIHLSELGHPLVGERVYIRDYRGPVIDAARPMLHARTLGFAHPRSGKTLSFESEPPEDFRQMLDALRQLAATDARVAL